MTHNINDLYRPAIVCTQTEHGTKSRGKKYIKETNSEWPT